MKKNNFMSYSAFVIVGLITIGSFIVDSYMAINGKYIVFSDYTKMGFTSMISLLVGKYII